MKYSFQREERARLEALRGLAALSVVLVHFGQIYWRNHSLNLFRNFTDLGKHGVILFFVLSAYLLTTGLNHLENPLDGFQKFMSRRFLRIYPAYLFCLIILVTFKRVDLSQFFSHVLLVQFLNSRLFGGINYPFWSLGVEFWFYALLPPLLMTLGKSQLRLKFLVIFSIIVSLIWEIIGGVLRSHFNFDSHYNWSSRLFLLSVFPAFALGIYRARVSSISKVVQIVINLGFTLAALDIIIGCFPPNVTFLARVHSQSHIFFQGGFGFFAYGCLSYKLLGTTSYYSFKRFWSFLETIGEFSYSLYLWHVPIFYFTLNHMGVGLISMASAFLTTFIVAKLSYIFIEKPFLIVSRRYCSSKSS